jgi:hypothetical protein
METLKIDKVQKPSKSCVMKGNHNSMPMTCFCFEKVTIKFKKEVGKNFVVGSFERLNFDHNNIFYVLC